MDWTEETISRLKDLWNQGLSTAEIGRQLGITKNAVVGKAHRLGLPARPSPIRKAAQPRAAVPAPEQPVSVAASVAADPAPPAVVQPAPKAAPQPAAVAVVKPARVAEKAPEIEAAAVDVAPRDSASVISILERRAAEARADTRSEAAPSVPRPALRSVPAEPRRRGPSCCWPLGDPGTPGFHFCGAHPLSGKPYCAEHAAIAYVKLRDRRDSVA